MAEPIYMRVGEGQPVELPYLVGAMGNFLGLLRELDSAVANKKKGQLRWKVTTLKDTPSPLVGVTPMLQRTAMHDISAQVEREVIYGVQTLTDRGERSKLLSDAALTRVERIASTAPVIGESAIYTETSGPLRLSTRINVKTLSQVRELTSPKSASFGSIVGNLDSISVHKGREFRVWDENVGTPVRCSFAPVHEAAAKDLLGKRVIASGMVQSDQNGQPLSMRVETLDSCTLSLTPSIDEVMGLVPDFTGGLSLREFFEDGD